jgi:carboxyl-terminal processing protease
MSVKYDFDFGRPRENAEPEQRAPGFNLILYTAVVVLIAMTSFVIGIMFERRNEPSGSADLATFWQAWDIIEQRYYGDLPSAEQRKWGAIDGMVASLGDPYTSFSEPELAAVRREEIDGHFGGVGIVITPNDAGQIIVVEVIPGNPAAEAGIQAGDIFVEIDGQAVQGIAYDQVGDMVKGELGTTVDITFLRPETDETFTVTLTRAMIETPTVASRNIDGIGYLQLASFNGVAASQMQTNIDSLLEQDVHALIFDLRGNGGGLLDQGVQIADMFLDDGVILTERSTDGDEEVFRSDDGDAAEDIPLVVLVDGGTASASEVVAGALQDRERAILIGQATYGKGVVQLVYDLIDGSQLRVTSAAWFTPDNQTLNGVGLTPEVDVVSAYDNAGVDLVIQAAVDYLNENYPGDEAEEE